MFPPPPEIEEHVLGSLQILSIMGQAMELYIPKVFEMFILTMGATIKELDQASSKSELPDGMPNPDMEPPTSGMAGMVDRSIDDDLMD